MKPIVGLDHAPPTHAPGVGTPGFLSTAGELGRLIAAFDWRATSIGPIDTWPAYLRTTISTILGSPVPIVTLWNDDGVMIYNDAYSAFAGARHPRLLGSAVRDGWPEVAAFNDHVMKTVLAGGTLSYREQELTLFRHGRAEQVWLDLDYSPVLDDANRPAGVIAIVIEATEKILAQRRLNAERERFRQMFDQSPSFMSLKYGPDHRTELVNPAYLRLMGGRDVIGKPIREALPDIAGYGFAELLDEAYATGEPRYCFGALARLQNTPGEPPEDHYLDFVYQPFRDETGAVIGIFAQGNDVTARVAAERLAREKDTNFQALAQLLPNHLWTARPDGSVDWFNQGAIDYFGTPDLDSDGDDWLAVIHPDDRATAGPVWQQAVRDGTPYKNEFRARRHDGAWRWFLARGIPIRDADNAIARWICSNTDIHDQKLAEAASTQDRNRLWQLSQELLVVCDFTGLITDVNPAVTRILGWAEAEFAGHNILAFIHPDDLDPSRAQLGRLVEGQSMSGYENRIRAKDGSYRTIAWAGVPEAGRIHSIGRDVTAERQAAAALAASRAERDRIWTTTNDLMAVVGLDGFIKSVNPAWSRLLGYDEAELLSRPFIEFIDPADRPRVLEARGRLARGERVTEFEDRLVHADGKTSLIAWTAQPMGDTFYAVGRDVTEQRAVEEALRQSQKMEAVGQLTGGIAHDFNNLLQGITGSLDLLQLRLQQGRLSDLTRFIAGAMGAANRAASLTHRLLAFSRRQPLDPQPVSANPLIAAMEDLLRRTMGERIDLELRLAADLWPTLCDPHQLENAVLNLAVNARDAMPDGGTLTIATSNTHLDASAATRAGDYVCIRVTDTGIGMTQDTMDKAFEPFFTTKPLGEGTGLGLSMIYGFVRQSEGFTKIASQLGEGTTLTLFLPRCATDAAADAAGADTPPALPEAAGETVLVVEDEPVVRGLIVEVLADLGYAALEATDGPAGLEILQSRQRIDLLITDVGLPGLNGRQVADAARLLRPGLKVIFMTGYAETAASAQGFLEPGMTMITKPFAMEVLAAKVHAIIEEGRAG
jgi:PAS domain S-box-containing protein